MQGTLSIAALFYRSGWTQERLAAKERKRQAWISKRVIFGKYLALSENNPAGLSLTERRFGSHWERTDKFDGNERQQQQRASAVGASIDGGAPKIRPRP